MRTKKQSPVPCHGRGGFKCSPSDQGNRVAGRGRVAVFPQRPGHGDDEQPDYQTCGVVSGATRRNHVNQSSTGGWPRLTHAANLHWPLAGSVRLDLPIGVSERKRT